MKVAVAGFRHGHITSIVDMIRNHPALEITACCESEPEKCAGIMEKCGVEAGFKNLDQMLEGAEFDMLVLGDIYAKRGGQAIKALKGGKHVLADKPLCTRMEELESIKEIVKDTGLSVIVGLSLRSTPVLQTARKLVQDGEIGEVSNSVITGYHGLQYRAGRPDWYFEKDMHGGTINDLMIHGIDAVQWITGEKIEAILSALTSHFEPEEIPFFQDVAMACFKLTNGAGVFIDSSYKTPEGHSDPWTFLFIGTGGSIEFNTGSNIILKKHNEEIREIKPELQNNTNFINDIVNEIEGSGNYAPLSTTAECLDSTAKTLAAQNAADNRS